MEPRQMQTVQVRISIPKRLFVCLREMLCLRRMSIQEYFEELASSDTEIIRNQKLRSTFLLPTGPKTSTIETTTNDIWRTKVRPEQVQRILFLSESEKMSPPEIAASMADVSRSTV